MATGRNMTYIFNVSVECHYSGRFVRGQVILAATHHMSNDDMQKRRMLNDLKATR